MEVFSTSDPKPTSSEHIHLFLELATGGGLFSDIDLHGALGEGETRWIFYQLMQGLEVRRGAPSFSANRTTATVSPRTRSVTQR